MKIKILLFVLLINCSMISTINSSEKDLQISAVSFNTLDRIAPFENAQDNSQEEKFYKSDKLFKILHASFMGIAYTGFIALDAIGIAQTSLFFSDLPYKDDTTLSFATLGVGIPTILSFATAISFAFTKFAIKKKNGFGIRKAHFAVAFVSLGFYLLDLGMTIVSSIFNANNYANKEWVNIGYNVVSSLLVTSLTVSLITIFL